MGLVTALAWAASLAAQEGVGEMEAELEAALASQAEADAFLAWSQAESEAERAAALSALEALAQEGDLAAIVLVASHYAKQTEGVEPQRKAYALYRKGAELGDETSQLMLGLAFEEGMGTPKDLQAAERWYRAAADQGNAAAMESLGYLLLSEEKIDRGLEMLERASSAGRVDASLYLGDAAFFGDYKRPDDRRALRFYRRAAEAGSGYGMRKVGDFYREGLAGLTVDAQQAREWYDRAREAGDAAAYEKLGTMALMGEGGDSDAGAALAFFEAGAERLDQASMGWLAYLYSRADWDGYDARKGYYWSYVALQLGVDEARAFMERTGKGLSEGERGALRREAEALLGEL